MPAMDGRTDTMEIGGVRADAPPGEVGLVTLYAPSPSAVPSAVALPPRALVLGRDPPPGALPLPFNSVSRVHARVAIHGAEILVEDLESRNGTFVNGRPVRKAFVEHDDELRVGEVVFKVVRDLASRYAEYPLEGAVPPAPYESLRGGFSMEAVRAEIAKIAKVDLSVLVSGETGTGKELVARALHDASGRNGRFFAVNCAAIPSALLESELFGYKRGAFTGADRDRVGLVKSAHGGTLFLDEIGDMPLDAQAKVLRMIETRHVTPLGSHTAESVDVRIVCATHRALPRLVREERFRGDLYARISGHTIRLPPLRDRKEDLYHLAMLFIERAGGSKLTVTPAFMIGLCSYDWPFNIRELESAMKRAVSLADGALEEAHLPADASKESSGGDAVEETSGGNTEPGSSARSAAPPEAALRAMLVLHQGNVAALARQLGKDRVQIRRWMKRYGLEPDEFRS
jgi:transcriptional regulator of acetoin/glycerol metabolism